MAKAVSVELLDEIFADVFDFHIIEPFISYEEQITVKQYLRKPKIEEGKAQALNFMKELDRKVKPKLAFEPKQKMINKLSIMARVNIPTNLLLLVNESDPADRKVKEETA